VCHCEVLAGKRTTWDALARTSSGKLILVEAKAHIEDCVDLKPRATEDSLARIEAALEDAKAAFGAAQRAPWHSPFYQYANRLAHLHSLRNLNGLDADLLFVYFADAPEVAKPVSRAEWQGAIALTETCLGVRAHTFRESVASMTWSVPQMRPAP
jgi:hypothetical protein